MPKGKGKNNGPNKKANYAAMYGWSLAILNSNPELKDLFDRAVKKGYTPERFIAELRDTKWFRTKSESVRKYIVLKATDPAEYDRRLKSLGATINDRFGALSGMGLGDKALANMADQALKMGWSDEELTDHVVHAINFHKAVRKDKLGGTAQQAQTAIEQAAASYGVRVHNKFIVNQLKRIVSGDDTLDGAINKIQKMSARRYENFRDEIEAGATLEEIAEPYRQSMATLLELNPGKLDVFNNKIQKALIGTRQEKGGDRVAMSISDFEDMVREDPRWARTNQAKEQVLGTGMDLLRSFGLAS